MGGRRHFTFSKMMCWVALDRGLRLAYKRSFPGNRDLWLKERDAIYEAIMEQGWHPGRQAFVQYFGSDVLDASMLLMPLVFFVSPTDPRMISTIDAILSDLTNDTLVNRYDVKRAAADGLGGQELQRMYILAGGSPHQGWPVGGGPLHIRADAGLRQPSGALLGDDWPYR